MLRKRRLCRLVLFLCFREEQYIHRLFENLFVTIQDKITIAQNKIKIDIKPHYTCVLQLQPIGYKI